MLAAEREARPTRAAYDTIAADLVTRTAERDARMTMAEASEMSELVPQ